MRLITDLDRFLSANDAQPARQRLTLMRVFEELRGLGYECGYLINLSVVDARFVWYASLTLIIAGHVIAGWLAHIQAQRRFTTSRVVLRSQLPKLALMVGYTAISLWILSQPIVEVAPQ